MNFQCPTQPGSLILSPKSCADMYQRGKRAEKWETAHHCRGCPIGAKHAGESVPVLAPTSTERCTHCGETAFKLVYGRLCVSCYNRLAEALTGKNARGKVPKKLSATYAGDLSWARCGGVIYVAVSGQVRMISRAPGVLPGSQWSLFDTIEPCKYP